ncbi:MAG: 3'(2'),5'-bisphosphate nucleotidase [Pirellulales bacterium]|nr:3'(2'),5'-bisphosphate nucleotidase [Pirellulales bacterium]
MAPWQSFPAESQFALAAVREASLLARRIQREMVTGALTKDDRSPVTVADYAVQALLARRLAEHYPGVALVGEEQADALRLVEGTRVLDQVTGFVRAAVPDATPEEVCNLIDRGSGEPPAVFWTLDPIDGTKGFLRREQYAVALALVKHGQVELGVLGCPDLPLFVGDGSEQSTATAQPSVEADGSLLIAARGLGTWYQPLNGEPSWRQLSVSARKEPGSARILRSVEKSHTNVDEIGQLAAKLGTQETPIGMDSQAKYAVLAAGEGDVLLRLLSPSRPDYREKIWDQAAGSIVVEEAGGRVTDLDGNLLDFSHGRTLARNRGIVATNGHLHDSVLGALRDLSA